MSIWYLAGLYVWSVLTAFFSSSTKKSYTIKGEEHVESTFDTTEVSRLFFFYIAGPGPRHCQRPSFYCSGTVYIYIYKLLLHAYCVPEQATDITTLLLIHSLRFCSEERIVTARFHFSTVECNKENHSLNCYRQDVFFSL